MKSKILLLENDLFHRELLAEGLEDYYDFEVERVDSLPAAQEAIRERSFDVLVLDVVVGVDRFEVLEWVKKLREQRGGHWDVAVLFVTAHSMALDEYMGEGDATDVLRKPFSLEDVTQKTVGLIGRRK
jgi:DNA-binding response OmpR family regulator